MKNINVDESSEKDSFGVGERCPVYILRVLKQNYWSSLHVCQAYPSNTPDPTHLKHFICMADIQNDLFLAPIKYNCYSNTMQLLIKGAQEVTVVYSENFTVIYSVVLFSFRAPCEELTN